MKRVTRNISPVMNTPLNRRHFLRLAALAPLATATPSHALTAIPRAGGASFRRELNAYSFLEQLNAKLAASGMRFANFYAASPRCTPTRAAFFTGRSPAALHMTFVGEGKGGKESSFTETGSKLVPPQ